MITTIDGSSTSWTDPTPVPGAIHAYQVAAVNVVGQGEVSDAVMATLPAPVPGATVAMVAGVVAVVAIVACIAIAVKKRR